jgi:hypothetical protein
MKDTQLKKDIMNIARAESAYEFTICCGTLFTKFNVSVHQQMADSLKLALQTFFDKRKVNDCIVKMSGPMGADEEYAYDFVPVVDFRLDGIGI